MEKNMDINNVTLTGRLCADVEVRYTPSQLAVGNFRLAVDGGKTKAGEKITDFIPCVVYGRMAETLAQYTGRGKRVSVVGHIHTGSYEGKNGRVYTTDIVADKVNIIDFKDSNVSVPTENIQEQFQAIDEDCSLPF